MLSWIVDKLTGPLMSIRMKHGDAKGDAGEDITKEAIFDAAMMNGTPYVI